MATTILQNCKLYFDGYDLSGDMNMLGINYAANELDATTFGQGTEVKKGGLKKASIAFKGFYQAGANTVDAVLHPNVGVSPVVVSISPEAGADGDHAYFLKTLHSELNRGAQIGELLGLDGKATATGGNPMVKGRILHPSTTTESTTASGVAQQLGATSATQKLYVALHVLSVGTTVTVKVQSDDNSAFTTPTDQVTFTAATVVGAQWTSVAGAITDDWYRINISAITGNATFVVAAGII